MSTFSHLQNPDREKTGKQKATPREGESIRSSGEGDQRTGLTVNVRHSIGAYVAVAHCNTVDILETVRTLERELPSPISAGAMWALSATIFSVFAD